MLTDEEKPEFYKFMKAKGWYKWNFLWVKHAPRGIRYKSDYHAVQMFKAHEWRAKRRKK